MQNQSPIQLNRLIIFAASVNAVHDFVKKSMQEKKQVIAHGLSNFREGLAGAFAETKSYANLLTLPVNNLLKDIVQIEREFREELVKDQEYYICLDGKMMPASQVLSMKMEENY